MGNPYVPQGLLNRVKASVIIPNFTSLNIASTYMSKKFVTVTFDDDFADQPETATGIVNSPKPYVMASVNVGLIRTQPLADSWLQQVQSDTQIGRVIVHSDSSTFPQLHIHNCSILKLEPGPYDGTDPTVDLLMRGVFYPNSYIWG